MPSTGPIRPARRGLLIFAAFLGLAAGAAGLSAAAGTGLHQSGPAQKFGWGIGILCFAVLIWLAANYSRWRSLSRALQPHSKTNRLRTATAAILFAGAVLVPILVIAMSRSSSPPNPDSQVQPTRKPLPEPTGPTQSIGIRRVAHGSSLNLTPFLITLGVVAGIALIALLVYRLREFRLRFDAGPVSARSEPEDEPEDQALADAMSAGRRALQGDDARAAIIACYAAMEQSLAAVGVARSVSDSPAELLGRVHARGLLRGSAPLTLTNLFREARYSAHPMGEEQMAAARTALEECAGQLRDAQAMAG
jgi:hypothetical protein